MRRLVVTGCGEYLRVLFFDVYIIRRNVIVYFDLLYLQKSMSLFFILFF